MTSRAAVIAEINIEIEEKTEFVVNSTCSIFFAKTNLIEAFAYLKLGFPVSRLQLFELKINLFFLICASFTRSKLELKSENINEEIANLSAESIF